MPSPITTDLATLLGKARDKLVSDNVFSASCVYVGLAPTTLQYPPGDQYAVVHPLPQVVDLPIDAGAGRELVYINGKIGVTLWSRNALDELPRDDMFLNDSSLGALAKVKCIYNSLHHYQPLDDSGNQLMAEPFRLLSIEPPKREFRQEGWGTILLTFEMDWNATLSC